MKLKYDMYVHSQSSRDSVAVFEIAKACFEKGNGAVKSTWL